MAEPQQQQTPPAMAEYRSSISPESAGELQRATEAMQRAAEAMIAATESFRSQIQGAQPIVSQPPVAYNPYRFTEPAAAGSASGSADGSRRSSAEQAPPNAAGTASWNPTPVTAYAAPGPPALTGPLVSTARSRPNTQGSLSSFAMPLSSPQIAHTVSITPVSAPPPAATAGEFMNARPSMPRLETGAQISPPTSSHGIPQRRSSLGPAGTPPNAPNHVVPQPATLLSGLQQHPPNSSHSMSNSFIPQPIGDMTPTADWPAVTGSTPTLAPLYATSSRQAGAGLRPQSSRASSSHHVDLFEAAERFKAVRQTMQHQQSPYQQQQSPYQQQAPPYPQQQQQQQQQQQPPPPQQQPQKQVHHPYPYPTYQHSPYQNSPLGGPSLNGSRDHFGNVTIVRADTDDQHQPLMDGQESPRGKDSGSTSHGIPRKPHKAPPVGPRSSSVMKTSAPKSGPDMSFTREVLFVAIICLAQVLMLAGIAQALVPAEIIGRSFPDTTPGDLAWYSAAYGLTAGTFVLPAGRLGDLFGHKRIFTIGFVWFALWSLLAGLAIYVQNGGGLGTVYFCFARAMQGIGPALQVPNAQALLGRTYSPGPRKALVMCLFGAAAPLGFVVGAVFASLFAVRASWEWSFFTLAAVNVALACLGVLILPSADPKGPPAPPAASEIDGPDGASHRDNGLWARLDVPGMILGVSGMVLFNFAWNQAPIVGWGTPYTYFLLVIGILLFIAFVYVERLAPHPLVPIAAMTSRTNYVLACTGCGWGCFSVWVWYAFQVIINQRGWDPLLASAGFAHAPVTGLLASILVFVLLGKLQWKPHWVMLISMCAFFVGSLLMATAPIDQPYWFNTFFSILIMPFGMDMSNPAATILLSNSVSKEHQGIAASLVVTVVNYGISIALGFAGTVEVQVNDGGRDHLAGIRGGQYFGLGLGALGILLALSFVLMSYRSPAPPPQEKQGARKV